MSLGSDLITHPSQSSQLQQLKQSLLQLTASQVSTGFFWFSLCIFGGLLLAPLWTITYQPLGDLPDHAAQMRVIQNYQEYQQEYRVNWLTPYWMGYGIALFLAKFCSIVTAIKLVMSLSLVATVVACHYLIRSLGGARYWLWICFPIAYSYSFFWGFFSYVVATPIAIAFFAYVVSYAQKELTVKSAVITAAFSLLLFVSHALAWALSVGLAASIVLIYNHWREAFKKSVVFVAILPVVVAWVALSSPAKVESSEPIEFGFYLEHVGSKVWKEIDYILQDFLARGEDPGHFSRVKEAFSFTIGQAPLWDFIFLSLLLFCWPKMVGARLSRNWRRWMPLTLAFLAFMVVPYWLFNTAYIYERFAVFLIPMLLFVYLPPKLNINRRFTLYRSAGFAIGGALVVFLLSINYSVFKSFQNNDEDFKKILAVMEPDKTVLALMFDQESEFRFSPPYMHYGSWYQAEKGGQVMPSFTHDHNAQNVPVRFKDTFWDVPSTWNPGEFNWHKHKGYRYDYFLIRSSDSKAYLFRQAGRSVELLKSQGKWHLYGKRAK